MFKGNDPNGLDINKRMKRSRTDSPETKKYINNSKSKDVNDNLNPDFIDMDVKMEMPEGKVKMEIYFQLIFASMTPQTSNTENVFSKTYYNITAKSNFRKNGEIRT